MQSKRKLKRKLPSTLFFVACLLLLSGILLVAGELWLKLSGNPTELKGIPSEAGEPVKSMTMLLLGVDARPGETVARTDTIIVAHIEPAAKRLCLLSIPRDTMVNIPRRGLDKINAANVYGGPELTARVVSDLIGLPVKYYALTNWEGFKNIVDTLGGVTIEVEDYMSYYDPVDGPEYAIDLEPGVQQLDGRKALQYVRCRNDALGDIARTERQLNFLKALASKAMQADTLLRLPKLMPQINKALQTNIGLKQMITLAQVAKKYNQMEIITQTLPGNFLNQDGLSYWAVDAQQAKKVAWSLFKDGQVTEMITGTAVNNGNRHAKTLVLESPEDKKVADNEKATPENSQLESPSVRTNPNQEIDDQTSSKASGKREDSSTGAGKKDTGDAASSQTSQTGAKQTKDNLNSIPAPKNSTSPPENKTDQETVDIEKSSEDKSDKSIEKTGFIEIKIY